MLESVTERQTRHLREDLGLSSGSPHLDSTHTTCFPLSSKNNKTLQPQSHFPSSVRLSFMPRLSHHLLFFYLRLRAEISVPYAQISDKPVFSAHPKLPAQFLWEDEHFGEVHPECKPRHHHPPTHTTSIFIAKIKVHEIPFRS